MRGESTEIAVEIAELAFDISYSRPCKQKLLTIDDKQYILTPSRLFLLCALHEYLRSSSPFLHIHPAMLPQPGDADFVCAMAEEAGLDVEHCDGGALRIDRGEMDVQFAGLTLRSFWDIIGAEQESIVVNAAADDYLLKRAVYYMQRFDNVHPKNAHSVAQDYFKGANIALVFVAKYDCRSSVGYALLLWRCAIVGVVLPAPLCPAARRHAPCSSGDAN